MTSRVIGRNNVASGGFRSTNIEPAYMTADETFATDDKNVIHIQFVNFVSRNLWNPNRVSVTLKPSVVYKFSTPKLHAEIFVVIL